MARKMIMVVTVFTLVACTHQNNQEIAQDGIIDQIPDDDEGIVTYTEEREPCADRNRLRNLYFGDLHVHTRLSFDAYPWGTRRGPAEAYRFALGELPHQANEESFIERPLDFAAVTDHSEFMGYWLWCDEQRSPLYDSTFCRTIRESGFTENLEPTESSEPPSAESLSRQTERCGPYCLEAWRQTQEDAEAFYDRTAECNFTTFVGYEYTYTPTLQWTHRNVIFRNANVIDSPLGSSEASNPHQLWEILDAQCWSAETGCDVIAIPHNSNYSSGRTFRDEYPSDLWTRSAQRRQATHRAGMEPLVEIFQAKEASECVPGFSADEDCNFEMFRYESQPPCTPDGEGMGLDCQSRGSYLRYGLGRGLEEWNRIGINPYLVGVIGSTDTHNATPGDADEWDFNGNQGYLDAAPAIRLRHPNHNPGGLAAVWAVENSRDALFEAMQRRETYATSGTRMAIRTFGGWEYEDATCDDANMLEIGYRDGVPMGGVLPSRRWWEEQDASPSPVLMIQVAQDRTPIALVQVIKGWLDPNTGEFRERVHDIADHSDETGVIPGVNLEDCEPDGNRARCCETWGQGYSEGCWVWEDPDFEPRTPAYYYIRVLENPTCRWSTIQCAELDPSLQRPPICDDPDFPRTIQERAWTSPIYYLP